MIAVIDVGGTKLAAARGVAGDLENVQRVATRREDPEGQLLALLERVLEGASPSAIGVSVPGPFDRTEGCLRNPPGMPETWHGLPVASLLAGRHHCPVAVENDANCAGLAEATWGVASGRRTVVYFTVSTGVGTGVVRDGTLWTGRHDTEGGHMVLWPEWAGGPRCHCGGAGCVEALASGRAIERRFGAPPETLEAQEVWDDVGRWLGLAAVNATALLDADAVVFGGGVCTRWERMAPVLHATVAEHLHLQPAPLLALGTLGETRNLRGALAVAAGRP